jgi:hypothetical protein
VALAAISVAPFLATNVFAKSGTIVDSCPGSAPLRQKTGPQTSAMENTAKDIRRATRKRHSAEDKIRQRRLNHQAKAA